MRYTVHLHKKRFGEVAIEADSLPEARAKAKTMIVTGRVEMFATWEEPRVVIAYAEEALPTGAVGL